MKNKRQHTVSVDDSISNQGGETIIESFRSNRMDGFAEMRGEGREKGIPTWTRNSL